MNADVRQALERLGTAYADLGRILSLPTEPGARIQWRTNGLIWRRVAEDEWQPEQEPLTDTRWPSKHIASDLAGWTTEIDETAGGH